MTFNGKLATTGTVLVLFVGACLMALQLPAKAAFMPLLIGVPGVLLCAFQLYFDIRSSTAQDVPSDTGDNATESDDGARSEAEMFMWLGLFTIVLLTFGFVAGGPLAVLLFVRFSSRDSWQNAFFAGLGTFAVLYGVFIWMLELTLFDGFLIEALLS